MVTHIDRVVVKKKLKTYKLNLKTNYYEQYYGNIL